MTDRSNGWEASAAAWIADMGQEGDFARRSVLDGPMVARVTGRGFRAALDVGCGEGRFCRMLSAQGIATTGVEPTRALREAAISRDPVGRYVDAMAESLPFANDSFDLVVSYLTLMDIDDAGLAISEMARVLRPGGTLLIANLNSFNTAGGWRELQDGTRQFVIDRYLEPRAEWVSWHGITIRNWHRPAAFYMQHLIGAGLRLRHFEEPAPTGGDPAKTEQYRRVPYFHVMEWGKD